MCTVLAKQVAYNRVQSTAINRELKCPQWQEPLYDALLEFNPERVQAGLIAATRLVIVNLRLLTVLLLVLDSQTNVVTRTAGKMKSSE